MRGAGNWAAGVQMREVDVVVALRVVVAWYFSFRAKMVDISISETVVAIGCAFCFFAVAIDLNEFFGTLIFRVCVT